jgi:transcriptional regulator with XRE-family HTH domain
MEQTINQRFKIIRKHYNLNQKDFGERLGIPQEVVSQIENGRARVTVEHTSVLIHEFKVLFEWLHRGEGPMLMSDVHDINPSEISTEAETILSEIKANSAYLEKIAESIMDLTTQNKKLVNIISELVSSGQRSKLLGNLNNVGVFPLPLAA